MPDHLCISFFQIFDDSMVEVEQGRKSLWVLLEQGFINVREVAKAPRFFRKKQRVSQSLNVYSVDWRTLPGNAVEQLYKTALNLQTKLVCETERVRDVIRRNDQDEIRLDDNVTLQHYQHLKTKFALTTIKLISGALVLNYIKKRQDLLRNQKN